MNFRSMAKTAATIALVLLMTSAMLMAMPIQPVKAQTMVPAGVPATNWQEGGSIPLPSGVTPDVRIKTEAYLSFRPNPVGVGQTFIVNMWIQPATHATRYLKNYKVTITKPDGTKDVITMDSYRADTTAWFEYIADQVGTWKLKFEFPGGYFPAGNYTSYSAFIGLGNFSFTKSCYYEPASTAEQTLTVREEIVLSWPPSPLPTDYWTRPVQPEHREWASILGDFPWRGPGGPGWSKLYPNTNEYWNVRQNFIPYVQAPNTAHIVWKQPLGLAGIIGSDHGYRYWNLAPGPVPLIFQGRAYQTITKVMPTGLINGTVQTLPVSVWQCFDIRTGEVYWEISPSPIPAAAISFGTWSNQPAIEYLYGTTAVPGEDPKPAVPNIVYIGDGRLLKFHPWTGAVTLNVSISPLTTGTYYMNQYVLTVQDLGAAAGALRYRLINWTTDGTTTNFTARIASNISWPISSLPVNTDFNVGVTVLVSAITPPEIGAWWGTLITAIRLRDGAVLWNITTEGLGGTTYSPTTPVADHGKIAVLMMDGRYRAWDLLSGKLVWTSEQMAYPWGSPGFGAYATATAYGLIYRFSYDGVYAFDWNTGKIVWKYVDPADSPYETPYTDEQGRTVYSWNAGGIVADGKLYTFNTEHTPSQPITRGWKLQCINATTGELIWKITTPGWPAAAADGYLIVGCTDGYQYVFGKGKSATTVTAPDTVIPKGTGITIKGTVLDMSPAQPGTPCVSKESMKTQMEYLHRQMPISGLWGNETITGVPVTLCAIDSKGNTIDIGTVTTNGYYGTFGIAWTPPDEGTYEIIASFAGDDSYGSSAASTFVSVGPAPEPYPEPIQPEPPIDNTPTIIGAAIAIIIAIIIAVAIATILILRKRP